MRGVARRQPRAGPGAHPGGAVGDQLGGRRAPPAGTRGVGARDHARETRPCAADPRQRPDRWPRHHRPSEILEAGTGGAAANRAAPGAVVSLGGQTGRWLPCRAHQAIDAPRREPGAPPSAACRFHRAQIRAVAERWRHDDDVGARLSWPSRHRRHRPGGRGQVWPGSLPGLTIQWTGHPTPVLVPPTDAVEGVPLPPPDRDRDMVG
jgi:hypothetical protein